MINIKTDKTYKRSKRLTTSSNKVQENIQVKP